VRIHLDPVGGLAGDMFVAAMVDALPHLRQRVLDAVDAVGLADEIRAELDPHADGMLTGHRFRVTRSAGQHDGADAAPAHRRFDSIRQLLRDAPLDDDVRTRAIDVFTHLAEAEGRVHGIAADDVTFHEVGAWDSIADVVAAAAAIVGSGATTWSVGPLPLGGGTVGSAHGALPVPAPATAILLEGFPVVDDGIAGERVTPTGAAILRSVGPTTHRPLTTYRLGRSGLGFGSRLLVGRSNVLRVLTLLAADDAAGGGQPGGVLLTDTVGVVEFDVDDQSAEDLAVGLERLRGLPGVLDVVQRPAFGKKGRLSIEVRILCAPESIEQTVEACFAETTTLGVRRRLDERSLLPRTVTEQQGLRVKTAIRPDGHRTAKVEIDDVARAGDRRAREALRRRVEASGEEVDT